MSSPVVSQPIDRFEVAMGGGDEPPGDGWFPAVVPGGVHESLMAAGRLAHPYLDQNEDAARWVDAATWWYRTTIDAPGDLAADERLVLSLPSLDTVADIWLDGEHIASHANAFRPCEVDVTARAKPGCVLHIRFRPPLDGLEVLAVTLESQQQRKATFAHRMPDGDKRNVPTADGVLDGLPGNLALVQRRKPTYSWGWDFSMRLPSVGVLAPGVLRRERAAVIAGSYVRTTAVDPATRVATVAVDVEVEVFASTAPLGVRVVLTAPDGSVPVDEQLDVVAGRAATVVAVRDAELWWPHDLGAQPLYDVRIELSDEQLLDEHRCRIGLRTVELDRSPDQVHGGRLFRFLVNGVPTFSRGANWVPPSLMRGSVSVETTRGLVETARRGEMNMIRIWGGGQYEPAEFYDACDELGVLVWHDFMFACIDYPSESPELRDEVAAEAAFQVRRLRNRACLAIWSGNNEVHAIHEYGYGDVEPGNWGWHFFHETLPDAVAMHSPGAIYWPGSPWGEDDPVGTNGVLDGDRHAWEVWHGMVLGAGGPTSFETRGEAVHFHRYGYDEGRYISEFGIHAAPEVASLERWTTAPLELGSAALLHRIKDTPKDKANVLMEHETGLPSTLLEYFDYSMACQAEGLKFGVEHYRRRQPHCSGTLVWQLNDDWPGLSWSVIDYDLVPKAGYYFLQRAFRPVVASFRDGDDGLELWLTNSGRTALDVRLDVEVASFDGRQELGEQVTVTSQPYSSEVVWRGGVERSPELFAWVSSPDGAIEANRLFFDRLKALPLTTGTVDARAARTSATTAEVELTATGYCYFTRVVTPMPGVVLDTGYLDLRDGDRRTVVVSNLPEKFDLAELQVRTYEGRVAALTVQG